MLFSSDQFLGSKLQLAREFRDLTQRELGDLIAASPALISLYENGRKKKPSRDLVEAFADTLGFDTAYFYGPVDDVFLEGECSFRHRRSTPERLKTQIRAHATLLGEVIKRLRNVFDLPALDVCTFPAQTRDQIEAAAEATRQYWKLGLEAPIAHVGRALENAGVMIIPHHSASSAKIDAFSRLGRTTVIFLNQAVNSTSRWNFDIAHECGHLVMHRGVTTGSIETEQAADHFASAFLMPERAFAREFSSAPFSWAHVFEVKRRWHTSAAAIVRRAYDLGLIGAVTYRQSCKYMSFKRWTKGEPFEPPFQQPELLRMALSALGSEDSITVSQLCRELHFAPKTFEEVTGFPVPAEEVEQKQVLLFPQASGQ